jgi:hypothetical protein
VKPYIWTLGSIWLTWFWALVAASVYEDVSSDDNAWFTLYLVWFLGIAVAALLSVLACAAIACVQCSAAYDRRTASR